MKLISLIGPNNCGKTTTLGFVYKMLLNDNAVSKNKQQEGTNPEDFSDELLYKDRTIIIFTMGDLLRPLLAIIKKSIAGKCDVLIIACNIKWWAKISALLIHPNTIKSKNKNKEPNRKLRDELNRNMAKEIFELVNQG